MRVRPLFAGSLISTFALAAGIACSSGGGSSASDAGSAVAPGAEAGATDAPLAAVDAPFTGPTQTGRIVDAVSGNTGVGGATITIAGKTVTTNDDGTYAIAISKGTPTSMSVTAPDHFKLAEQEWIVKTDLFDRMDTALLSTATANFLATLLPARDPAKGLLAVRVFPLPPCTSEQDATLTLTPAGTSKLTYFKGGLPDKSATGTTKDQSFSGIFTDVEPGVPITITVTSPSCVQLAYPVDYGGVSLTGAQKTEPGDVVSYVRAFLGPTKIADAGTD